MEFRHTSVLFSETIKNLNIKPDGIYADGTLGGGGHASGICEKLDQKGIFIGIDRDGDAIRAAGERLKDYPCRKIYVQNNYANIKDVLKEQGLSSIHGAILDLGVSSFQLDNYERGFSYMQNAPLDMK
jgi:16S rRNA (cytosine1402-N4)-methyltransferase